MIVFQNKIIYMPGLPPNARRERIQDYSRQCGGVVWEEKRTRAADGTDLALCIASVESTGPKPSTSLGPSASDVLPVYILYFQGLLSPLFPATSPFFPSCVVFLFALFESKTEKMKLKETSSENGSNV